MTIVAGSLTVEPRGRDAYLEGCESVVSAARQAEGCLGSGPDAGQLAALLEVRVGEYAVVEPPR